MTTAAPITAEEVLMQHLREAYMEVFPAEGILDGLRVLEDNAYVAVTCSPSRGVEPTLALVAELVGAGFRVVPHIAARNVYDKAHLRDIMRRIEALGVESIFVPGGDRPEAAGEYATALELLEDLAAIGHDLRYVGVAAHPEGHTKVEDDTLIEVLARKQAYANYMVTQLCFDAPALARWLAHVRERGIAMPVWIGLPGVIDRARLIRTSIRIGVGDSLRFLQRNTRGAAKLLGTGVYRPDALLAELAPVAANPAYGVAGYHLFCFNQVGATEAWRKERSGVPA